MSHAIFCRLLKMHGLPQPEPEYRFHPTRKWRMDFAFPEHKLGLEVDGGIFMRGGGRHTRGAGWLKDAEKLNTGFEIQFLNGPSILPRNAKDRAAIMRSIEQNTRILNTDD